MFVTVKLEGKAKMSKQVRFKENVSQAVFNTTKGSKRCIEEVELCPLTEESEVAARTSAFQLIQRQQKQATHEYHINKRKRSRLHMRNDILEVFWSTYEDEAWTRLIDIADNPVTTKDVDTFAVQAITSVNKSELIKRWREQLMTLMPIVEQHHMVPFHDRFINSLFKEEENIQSNHWLSELVQELTDSSDTELLDELDLSPDGTTASESQFDMLSEALIELESLHPELFENLPLPENVAQDDISTQNNELTDDEMVESMEHWEKEMNDAFDSYDYLLENEVRTFP